MSAVDRVMQAYASKHDLTVSQAAFVREELAKIIDEMKTPPGRVPAMVPETRCAADLRFTRKRTSEPVGDNDQ